MVDPEWFLAVAKMLLLLLLQSKAHLLTVSSITSRLLNPVLRCRYDDFIYLTTTGRPRGGVEWVVG